LGFTGEWKSKKYSSDEIISRKTSIGEKVKILDNLRNDVEEAIIEVNEPK
jgi:hypothetical protein